MADPQIGQDVLGSRNPELPNPSIAITAPGMADMRIAHSCFRKISDSG
jgi:hypothetical protein